MSSSVPHQGCKAVDGMVSKAKKPTLLCVCDSPTLTSGFARVAQNLIRRWRPHFERIDIWGIGHTGWPSQGEWSAYDIFPAGWPFQTAEKYAGLCNLIASGRYTHLWMMQDLFNLGLCEFPDNLFTAMSQASKVIGKTMVSACYFPVDAPLDPEWTKILRIVSHPVAYTEYGAAEAKEAMQRDGWSHRLIANIPHGVDTKVYRPIGGFGLETRKEVFVDGWADDAWLMVNVNSNQRRKGLVQSFETLKALLGRGLKVKLYMHMAPQNAEERTDLISLASQLGLKEGDYWRHGGAFFRGGSSAHAMVSEPVLNKLYNAADILLTTTLGEGWGLSITEGLAAGLECFVPNHTSCREIARKVAEYGCDRIHTVPLVANGVMAMMDNSRVRYPVDSMRCAEMIDGWIREQDAKGGHVWVGRQELEGGVREWLEWDTIAKRWLALFGVR